MSKFQIFLIVLYLFFFGGVGGWVLEEMQHIPAKGESFEYPPLTVTVDEADEKRVSKVLVAVKPEEEREE